LAEVGRDAVAMGHRFWGLASFIDAVRLGHGSEVVSDIEHLAITRGAGLAVLAGRHARAESREDLWSVARMWWGSGARTYAIEAAVRAASSDEPLDGVGVFLMALQGGTPLVEDLSTVEQPLSERQLDIVARALAGASNDQIADVLYLSRRTIENHLQRAYRGLGIKSGRKGLMDELGWIEIGGRPSGTPKIKEAP
jgi:DNA-binding CsgD family transcriptional regulator